MKHFKEILLTVCIQYRYLFLMDKLRGKLYYLLVVIYIYACK